MSGIRTTNFDALLASDPGDTTAAVVTGRSDAPGMSLREQSLMDVRRAVTATIGAIRAAKANGLPTAELNARKSELEKQIHALKPGTKKERKALHRLQAPAFEAAFVEKAKRLLSKPQFEEIRLAATGRLTIQSAPADMWERA
jgi:hypothetical protein